MLLELFRCKVIKLYLKAYKNREINDSICKKIYCKVIFDGKNSLSNAKLFKNIPKYLIVRYLSRDFT